MQSLLSLSLFLLRVCRVVHCHAEEVEFLNMVCICHQWENERQDREREAKVAIIYPSFHIIFSPAETG